MGTARHRNCLSVQLTLKVDNTVSSSLMPIQLNHRSLVTTDKPLCNYCLYMTVHNKHARTVLRSQIWPPLLLPLMPTIRSLSLRPRRLALPAKPLRASCQRMPSFLGHPRATAAHGPRNLNAPRVTYVSPVARLRVQSSPRAKAASAGSGSLPPLLTQGAPRCRNLVTIFHATHTGKTSPRRT
jgi:hypothetical protein